MHSSFGVSSFLVCSTRIHPRCVVHFWFKSQQFLNSLTQHGLLQTSNTPPIHLLSLMHRPGCLGKLPVDKPLDHTCWKLKSRKYTGVLHLYVFFRAWLVCRIVQRFQLLFNNVQCYLIIPTKRAISVRRQNAVQLGKACNQGKTRYLAFPAV